MNKMIKNPMFTFILGAIIFGSGILITLYLFGNKDSAASNKIKIDYSTNEHAVGSWIDGKTVYQKTFQIKANQEGETVIATDLNIESICKIDAIVNLDQDENSNGDNSWRQFPVFTNGGAMMAKIAVFDNKNQTYPNSIVIYTVAESIVNRPIFVTIEYTKADA